MTSMLCAYILFHEWAILVGLTDFVRVGKEEIVMSDFFTSVYVYGSYSVDIDCVHTTEK